MLFSALSAWPTKDVECGMMTCAICDDGGDGASVIDGYTLPARMGICLNGISPHAGVAPEVYLMGPPRGLPQVKNTEWPRQRQGWESRLPATASEGLLWSPEGHVTEGFTTNFFVVANTGGQVVVETAPNADVLGGIVRSRVIDACAELGLPVHLSRPDSEQRSSWTEAFVCNSLRLIQPVQRIICNGEDVWTRSPWQWEAEACPGPVTTRLQERLESSWCTTSIADLRRSEQACLAVLGINE